MKWRSLCFSSLWLKSYRITEWWGLEVTYEDEVQLPSAKAGSATIFWWPQEPHAGSSGPSGVYSSCLLYNDKPKVHLGCVCFTWLVTTWQKVSESSPSLSTTAVTHMCFQWDLCQQGRSFPFGSCCLSATMSKALSLVITPKSCLNCSRIKEAEIPDWWIFTHHMTGELLSLWRMLRYWPKCLLLLCSQLFTKTTAIFASPWRWNTPPMCLLPRRLKAQTVGEVPSVQCEKTQRLHSYKYIPPSDLGFFFSHQIILNCKFQKSFELNLKGKRWKGKWNTYLN